MDYHCWKIEKSEATGGRYSPTIKTTLDQQFHFTHTVTLTMADLSPWSMVSAFTSEIMNIEIIQLKLIGISTLHVYRFYTKLQ